MLRFPKLSRGSSIRGAGLRELMCEILSFYTIFGENLNIIQGLPGFQEDVTYHGGKLIFPCY